MPESILTKIILYIIVSICVVVWAIVGFVFWIPLLFRATMVFSAMVVHATLTNQSAESVRGHLEAASAFYPNGFRTAVGVLRTPSPSSTHAISIELNKVIVETLWTLIFWFISLLLVGALTLERISRILLRSFNSIVSFVTTYTLFSIVFAIVIILIINGFLNLVATSRKRSSK